MEAQRAKLYQRRFVVRRLLLAMDSKWSSGFVVNATIIIRTTTVPVRSPTCLTFGFSFGAELDLICLADFALLTQVILLA